MHAFEVLSQVLRRAGHVQAIDAQRHEHEVPAEMPTDESDSEISEYGNDGQKGEGCREADRGVGRC